MKRSLGVSPRKCGAAARQHEQMPGTCAEHPRTPSSGHGAQTQGRRAAALPLLGTKGGSSPEAQAPSRRPRKPQRPAGGQEATLVAGLLGARAAPGKEEAPDRPGVRGRRLPGARRKRSEQHACWAPVPLLGARASALRALPRTHRPVDSLPVPDAPPRRQPPSPRTHRPVDSLPLPDAPPRQQPPCPGRTAPSTASLSPDAPPRRQPPSPRTHRPVDSPPTLRSAPCCPSDTPPARTLGVRPPPRALPGGSENALRMAQLRAPPCSRQVLPEISYFSASQRFFSSEILLENFCLTAYPIRFFSLAGKSPALTVTPLCVLSVDPPTLELCWCLLVQGLHFQN
ncbi:proline-rich protein 36-like [Moschus berezovskii]|uniref:proline-rich protein 36-like n=1 Tax=Moschus berezovskii TaxID=68408 RepID=UPI0024446FB4|nr:proline-rich protein 36-like [Moschus berezovskii]